MMRKIECICVFFIKYIGEKYLEISEIRELLYFLENFF
jgi:hypothetical protein